MGVCGWDTVGWQAVWPKLIEEVPLILEAADALISGPCGNGGDLVPPIVNVEEGICFNGVADDGHEPFCLSRQIQNHFVKTLQKPYDTAVACILLRAHLLAPNNFRLQSDGTWDQIGWKKVRQLYQELWLGEPIWCPWEDDGSNAENSYDKPVVESSLKAQLAVGVPHNTIKVTENLKTLELDLPSSSQHGPVRSTVSEMDFSPIRQWLSRCEEDTTHNECKASKIQWKKLPGVQFRAIDVHRRCIVDAPDDCSFIVLTYVWGGVDQPKLTVDTMPYLMREGGLEVVWPRVPMTIRDAITVCERLGERYLWVDALCIMQDSVRDMKLQILRMRQIYTTAKCAIVAVSADTADVGLLGSSTPNSYWACDSVDCLNSFLESSPWSSRAWCYQEKVLSHRVILFTSSGAYMQCQNGSYNAKGIPLARGKEDQSLARFNAVGGMLSVSPEEGLEAYISAVEYYSQRKLTKQEDKMNAFQGIIQRYRGRLDSKNTSFFYGLPISAFDQAFCWRTYQHSPHLRNKGYPSWSWLGWNDTVLFDRKMIRTARTSQMIYGTGDYCYRDESGGINQLRKPASYTMQDGGQFGFPTAVGGQFHNSPEIFMYASVAHLSIAPDPVESSGSNGLYAVFPTKCGEQPPPPPRQMMTLYEFLKQPLPKINLMDAETMAAPSLPATKQTEEIYDPSEHENHMSCQVKTPLGYIWLSREWREKQPDQCIMGFMALAGEKEVNKEGQWIITMLMCLQRMEKNRHVWAMERVQAMHCEIGEKEWLKTRAKVILVKLT